MEKIWKIILIGVVLIVIAVPLGFLIKNNFTQRLAKMTSQGMDAAFGLKSFPAIDKAKEAAQITEQTNQEITQKIEDLTGTTSDEIISTSTATSTN